jgi:MFS family permease
MTICGLLLAAGYMLMSIIGAIWQLYLFYGVFIGTGVSAGYAPSVSTVARWFTKKRGLMTGIAVSGIGFGTVVVPPIASWLISSYGWRTCYLIISIAVLVIIISAAQLLKRDPSQMQLAPYGEEEANFKNPDPTPNVPLHVALRSKNFWLLCLMLMCFDFVLGTIMLQTCKSPLRVLPVSYH